MIYPPDGHPQLDLGHGPEEGVDGVDDSFGLFVTVLGDTAQSGVQRDTSYSYSFKGWKNDSVKMENFFSNLKANPLSVFGYLHSSAHL